MTDTIDCTDKPKITGKELYKLINDRFWDTQKYVVTTYPHRLIITEDQFKTINGGVETKRNRYVWGPVDHTGTASYCLEVEVVA